MRDFLKEMKDQYRQIMDANNPDKAQKVSLSFCPTTWGKPCKLCDACKEILWHKDAHTAEQIEQAGEYNRKPKFYANVLLLTNPSEVLLFEYGKTIGDKLGIYEMDDGSELKGFSHPHTGRNIIIVKYPHPDKRKTRYDVEPRISVSSLSDMGVLQKLRNLDDIPNLLASGVQPLYQSKLAAQRTEIRWLPSWLGPQYASVFQVRYFIHYHVSEEELAAINKGELSPIAAMNQDKPAAVPETPVIAAPPVTHAPYEVSTGRTGIVVPTPVGWGPAPEATPTPTNPPTQSNRPGCYGTYDEGDPLCQSTCKIDAASKEACKAEAKLALDKRRQARGLYK